MRLRFLCSRLTGLVAILGLIYLYAFHLEEESLIDLSSKTPQVDTIAPKPSKIPTISVEPHSFRRVNQPVTSLAPTDIEQMETTEINVIFLKQFLLERELAAAAETLMLQDYRRYLAKVYSEPNIIELYVDEVPETVLTALIELRDSLVVEGKQEYLYMMPHLVAYHLLANQLVEQYLVHQNYGSHPTSLALLTEAKSQLELYYGDSVEVIINFFGIENLPIYSNLLLLKPSDQAGHTGKVHFQQVIDELFPERSINPADLKSVYPIRGITEVPDL